MRPSSASAKRQFTLSREYSKSPGAYGFGAFFCVGQRACACALGLRTQGGPIAVHMPGGTLWVRAEPTSAMPAQGTAQTGAPHPASAPNGMRVLARTGRHPYYFLGDGTKGRRAKRPPVSFPSGMFIRPFNGLFRARPGGGQPVSAFSCGASGPRPARQTADKPPARAQTPPRRNRRLSARTSAYPAHS